MLHKKALVVSICFAFLALAGAIAWMSLHPYSFQAWSIDHAVNCRGETTIETTPEEKNAYIGEMFEEMSAELPTVRPEFPKLKVESAPPLRVAFPKAAALKIDIATPTKPMPSLDTEKIWAKESLQDTLKNDLQLAPLAPEALLGTPPLAPLNRESDLYGQEGAIAGSEHFDIQVEYAPKRSRPGYVFKVTLQPRPGVVFKRIRQNYYFLLDRSNSMPRARYFLNKKAVSEALALLQEGDRFNILVFDDHVVRFHQTVVDWSAESVQAARAFLEGQGHGGYFAATDLYTSLGKIIPQDVAENEINTAILLSDGDTYLSPEKQRLMIGGWTARNNGKVSLYTVTSGEENNIALLELLSSFNKGVLIHAQSHQEVVSRLAYLMHTIKTPIGKQMVATAAVADKGVSVLLQPKAARIPDLYQNRPFVIYGSTNRLSEFVLFLQGRYYDQRFDIKKKIVFDHATIGPHTVERGWTQLIAQEFYERYFEHGDTSYLESAKQLLTPLNLPTPLLN